MKMQPHDRAGFSLVEVMCAILILGVGLLGLVQGLTTALGSNKESETQTIAAFIAAGRIETLRADGYLIVGETSGDCDEIPLYQWQESIIQTAVEGLHEIRVVVENTKTGKAIYELRTLLFDPPVSTTDSQPTSPKKAGDRQNRGSR
jgi:prepilin-type N-terminal cleavage/methylation domain-containing protein